jgi:hypothetical protein
MLHPQTRLNPYLALTDFYDFIHHTTMSLPMNRLGSFLAGCVAETKDGSFGLTVPVADKLNTMLGLQPPDPSGALRPELPV